MIEIIVTGATGFIGSHFISHLVDRGIGVLALGRKDLFQLSDQRQCRLKGSDYLNIDMREILSLPDAIQQYNLLLSDNPIFINLAWGGVDRLSDLNIEAQLNNVGWSVNALEAAAKINCKRFVHIGTMEEAFTYKYLDLDHRVRSEYNRHVVYSVAKIAAKNTLKAKASLLGIDYIHVLHSHVMGPDDDKDSFLQVTLQRLVEGEDLTFSSGEQLFDVISLDDCCNGYRLICEKGVSGSEYWVGSGDPRQLKEYVERMYRLYPSKRKLNFGKLPYNDIKLEASDFSIELLARHTGYSPSLPFEDIVIRLHDSLFKTAPDYLSP